MADKGRPRTELVRRHAGLVRLTHWINVVALLVLLMSGLQIFNAHPNLYIGQESGFEYDNAIVVKFMIATALWGLVAFLVGLIVALKLVTPAA